MEKVSLFISYRRHILNTPDVPGYYWFRGTGVIQNSDDFRDQTDIHGIIQIDWWFDKVEPYLGGDYIDPSTMNGIWSEKLVSPFGEEKEQEERKPDILTVTIGRKTMAIIQDMALNYFDPAAGKHVLDWIHQIDNPE
jgi:hypothetical protein